METKLLIILICLFLVLLFLFLRLGSYQPPLPVSSFHFPRIELQSIPNQLTSLSLFDGKLYGMINDKLYYYIEEKEIWKMAFPLYKYDVNKMLDDAEKVFSK